MNEETLKKGSPVKKSSESVDDSHFVSALQPAVPGMRLLAELSSSEHAAGPPLNPGVADATVLQRRQPLNSYVRSPVPSLPHALNRSSSSLLPPALPLLEDLPLTRNALDIITRTASINGLPVGNTGDVLRMLPLALPRERVPQELARQVAFAVGFLNCFQKQSMLRNQYAYLSGADSSLTPTTLAMQPTSDSSAAASKAQPTSAAIRASPADALALLRSNPVVITDSKNRKPNESFPERLFRMLIEVQLADKDDIISFTPDGNAFEIHQSDIFCSEIIPLYFRHARMSSFRRQLSMYGFKRLDSGLGERMYAHEHEMFQRDKPQLLKGMKRVGDPDVKNASLAAMKQPT